MYLNRITLIGFIGSDAERKTANPTNIAIFSLATKTSWKNDAGSWESRTEWHRCMAFGKLADFAGSLTKGAHIAIEGELRSREFQRELTVGTQKDHPHPARLGNPCRLRPEARSRREAREAVFLCNQLPATTFAYANPVRGGVSLLQPMRSIVFFSLAWIPHGNALIPSIPRCAISPSMIGFRTDSARSGNTKPSTHLSRRRHTLLPGLDGVRSQRVQLYALIETLVEPKDGLRLWRRSACK